MSEENESKGGFFSNLKNQIIAGATAILATLGTVFIDEVKSIFGLEAETEQVQGVQQNNQQSQSNNQSQNVVINIPQQQAAPSTKTVVIKEKEVPAKPVEKKKEKEQETSW
jgi:hypothetical protein